MLKFNSVSDVNTVLNQLESDYDLYNDNYDAQYPGYTTDELDRMDSINNFDEFRKLKDFEAKFPSFSSKRKQIENEENNWLNNNFTGTDPDTLDLTFDDFENTIFNSSYSFKVGTSVYQLKANGIYINGVLQTGTSGEMSIMSTCMSGKKTMFDHPPGSNKRYKLKVAVHSIGFRSSAKGKVVSFKQKNSGKWKRSRSEMAVYAGGNIYTPQCYFNFQFSNRKPISDFKKRRSLKVAYRQYGAGGQIIFKTMPGELSALYELKSGYSARLTL